MQMEQQALGAVDKAASRCADCGAPFVCGAAAGLSTCWCMDKPAGLLEPIAGAGCYCAACLDQRIAATVTVKPGNAAAA